MKKAAIINFKGGVGKTTLSLHLACHLASESNVLLVDVDHQSSLSLVMLGDRRWQRRVDDNLTVNRVFESFTNRRVPMPGDEIIVRSVMGLRHRNLYPRLDLVPAQFELDDTEIDLASTTYGTATVSDWEKRTLLCEWLDRIQAADHYDYVLFDCPPATKIVSQNALACSDCFVTPVIPDELSSRGVTHFRSLVQRKIDEKLEYLHRTSRISDEQTPDNYVAETQMAAIVPYLAKSARGASGLTNIHTIQLASLRRQWGRALIPTIGKNYIGIPEAVNAGLPVWNLVSQNARRPVISMMRNICQELKDRIDAS